MINYAKQLIDIRNAVIEHNMSVNNYKQQQFNIFDKIINIPITFGKYKGNNIEYVINKDYNYFCWLCENNCIKGLRLETRDRIELKLYVNNKLNPEPSYEPSRNRDKEVEYLVNTGMSRSIAENCLYNRNCRDFGM